MFDVQRRMTMAGTQIFNEGDQGLSVPKMVESKINALIETCCEEDRRKADLETVNNFREHKKELQQLNHMNQHLSSVINRYLYEEPGARSTTLSDLLRDHIEQNMNDFENFIASDVLERTKEEANKCTLKVSKIKKSLWKPDRFKARGAAYH